jgi:glutaminyl-tRNA synthetase
MSEEKSLNFIEEIIEEDLKSGKHFSIITRFPPEPNGYLHIGHAKSIYLNFGLTERYGGYTNLRFDDTNPVTEETEYVDSIKEDVEWLGFHWKNELYASDYFDQLYGFAIKLIEKNLAYVDDLSAEEIAAKKGTPTEPGQDSPYRNRSTEENATLKKCAPVNMRMELKFYVQRLIWLILTCTCVTRLCIGLKKPITIEPVINGASILCMILRMARVIPSRR